jgi:hypothetical protein
MSSDEERLQAAIPAEFHMISGSQDRQTSADVFNVNKVCRRSKSSVEKRFVFRLSLRLNSCYLCDCNWLVRGSYRPSSAPFSSLFLVRTAQTSGKGRRSLYVGTAPGLVPSSARGGAHVMGRMFA